MADGSFSSTHIVTGAGRLSTTNLIGRCGTTMQGGLISVKRNVSTGEKANPIMSWTVQLCPTTSTLVHPSPPKQRQRKKQIYRVLRTLTRFAPRMGSQNSPPRRVFTGSTRKRSNPVRQRRPLPRQSNGFARGKARTALSQTSTRRASSCSAECRHMPVHLPDRKPIENLFPIQASGLTGHATWKTKQSGRT